MFCKSCIKSIAGYTLLILTATLLLAACAPATTAPTTPTISAEMVLTQAAVAAYTQLTQAAAQNPSPVPSNTPAPSETPAAPVDQPASQPATALPIPTHTSAPASQPNLPPAADSGSFDADITVPDGTVALPGSTFDKIWRIKNTGTTTWSAAYALVFIDGERMGAPDKVNLTKEVRPGETIDITVKLTAPTKVGSYQTYFRLRNAAGQFFKLDGSGDLWLKILVGTAPATATGTPDPNSTATDVPAVPTSTTPSP